MDGRTVPRGNHVPMAWTNISISAYLQARACRGELFSIGALCDFNIVKASNFALVVICNFYMEACRM